MARRNKAARIDTGATTRKAVAYARVSTKEQEKEGFSIEAQQRLMAGYAQANGIVVVSEFVDVETAKQSGRTNFEEMIRYLKKHRDIKAILVEKTDRLYRNFRDWVTLDEFEVELHLVKEGTVISRDSRSSEKFVHAIKVVMAKNYIDNLSEEARKGMAEKAQQGFWPTSAPMGYLNTRSAEGKKIIEVDTTRAPIVRKLFEWYVTGNYSIGQLRQMARAEGLVSRVTSGPVGIAQIHNILRNRLYTGEYEWNGCVIKGRHEPIVSYDLWERVQLRLEDRGNRKTRRGPRGFAFSGLMTCGHCGCAMVGEMKKGKYIYYHCTGYKQKCPDTYVREEAVAEKFSGLLARLRFDEQVHQWIVKGLHASLEDERKEHDAAVGRLQAEHDRLSQRLRAIYIDKVDGRLDPITYDDISSDWRKQQDRCLREIAAHQAAERSYMDEGVALLTLAKDVQAAFDKRPVSDKRKLLNFVLSNSVWKSGELIAHFRKPFDLIVEMGTADPHAEDGGSPDSDRTSSLVGPAGLEPATRPL